MYSPPASRHFILRRPHFKHQASSYMAAANSYKISISFLRPTPNTFQSPLRETRTRCAKRGPTSCIWCCPPIVLRPLQEFPTGGTIITLFLSASFSSPSRLREGTSRCLYRTLVSEEAHRYPATRMYSRTPTTGARSQVQNRLSTWYVYVC